MPLETRRFRNGKSRIGKSKEGGRDGDKEGLAQLRQELRTLRLAYKKLEKNYRQLQETHAACQHAPQRWPDQTRIAHLSLDRQGTILTATDTATRLLDLPPDEQIQRPLGEFFQQESRNDLLEQLHAIIHHPETPCRQLSLQTSEKYSNRRLETLLMAWDASSAEPHQIHVTLADRSSLHPELEALRHGDAKWRTLTENGPCLIFLLDDQGTVLFSNQQRFSLALPQMVGDNLLDHLPEHRRLLWRKSLIGLRRGNGAEEQEINLPTEDGKGRWWSFRIGAIREGRAVVGFLITGTDITPRKEIEETLHLERSRFGAVLEMIPAYIYLLDANYSILYANSRFYRLFGDPKQGPCYTIMRNLRKPCANCPATRTMTENTVQHWEWTDQTGHSFMVHDYLLDRSPGAPLILGIGIDITARKQAEEALRQSEQHFRAIVEDQNELICRFQPDGILTFVNGAFCRFFNKEREELLGKSFFSLAGENPLSTVRLPHQPSCDAAITDEEQRIGLANGESRWLHWSHRAICHNGKNVCEYQSVGRDITAEKRVQETFLRLKDELELQERHRLARLLHDGVGQSMQAIQLGLKMVLATMQQGMPPTSEVMPELLREVAETIDQLRSVTTELSPSFLERMELLDAIRWWSGKLSQRTGITIRFQTEGVIPSLVLRTKHNCFRILQEGLTNAIKHSGASEVLVSLACPDGNMLHLKIEDHGCGFDPERLAHSASGLGLSIIPERVAGLGGSTDIRSLPGQGTSITIHLPIREENIRIF